jgi:uroporphyrin-III C-methyltransferase
MSILGDLDRRSATGRADGRVRPGRVWLVGAGPGDPELLTVRGRRLLETADIVLHDRLVGPALLALIPRRTLTVDVGKVGHGPSSSQDGINAQLIRFALAGNDVVRLKGGDPFVFGRGGEEAAALRAAGIPFEIVPGISAGIAGPAYAGIPVTHRGVARTVAFVTAQEGTADGAPVDWEALARLDTLVVFMAGTAAASVARRLIDAGRPASTPVALIVDASLPHQVVWSSDLETVRKRPPVLPAHRPCLMVVGEVVALGAQLAWFASTVASPAPAVGPPAPRPGEAPEEPLRAHASGRPASGIAARDAMTTD